MTEEFDSSDVITVDQVDDETYALLRDGEQVATVLWSKDVEASLGEAEISRGRWYLARVGEDEDEALNEAHGKDDLEEAIKQAKEIVALN
jgi:HEPN domain-containing protein